MVLGKEAIGSVGVMDASIAFLGSMMDLMAATPFTPLWLYNEQRKMAKWAEEVTTVPGEPSWTTPNRIILALGNTFLRDFTSGRSFPHSPVLIAPPQAGHHSSIADYGPGQSLVEASLQAGRPTYAMEWRPATSERSEETIDNFVSATKACVDAICPGDKQLTLVGLCQGGWQSAIYAALYPEKVNHLVLAGSPIDFLAGNGKIQTCAETFPMEFYESMVAMGGGNMPGRFMLTGFKMLNPVDRYVKDPLEVYQHIDDEVYLERYRKFRDWYEYTQDLPGAFYLQVVRELFKGNKLIKGELKILGQRVDLSRITCPATLIAGDKDDITLAEQVFNAEHYLGTTDVVKMLAPAGHIGIFMAKEVVKKNWPGVFVRSVSRPEPGLEVQDAAVIIAGKHLQEARKKTRVLVC